MGSPNASSSHQNERKVRMSDEYIERVDNMLFIHEFT